MSTNVTDDIEVVDFDGDDSIETIVFNSTEVWTKGPATGQDVITSSGVWTCPLGVTSISFVMIGSGGAASIYAGGGGELGYKNNVTVVPETEYTVTVGAFDSGSYTSIVIGGTTYSVADANASVGGSGGSNMDAAYDGGDGGNYIGRSCGGGSAGGYSANGVDGKTTVGNGNDGAGGSGGSGATLASGTGGSGGGTGILGAGASGTGGLSAGSGNAVNGTGGSGGTIGATAGTGGTYGGGGGINGSGGSTGVIRIIYPGDVRQFPSTRTGDE